MKVVVYDSEGKELRRRDCYPNSHVLDASGQSPKLPQDGEQKELKIAGGNSRASLALMYSVLLGGWVSSVNHPELLPEGYHARTEEDEEEVAKVA